jgi:hypothetical protein
MIFKNLPQQEEVRQLHPWQLDLKNNQPKMFPGLFLFCIVD